MDAVQACGAVVDSYRLRLQSKRRTLKQQRKQPAAEKDDENRRWHGNARDEAADSAYDGVIQRRRRAAVDPVGNGAAAGVQNERGDHGLNFKRCDQRAVKRAKQHCDEATCEEGQQHHPSRAAG